MYFRIGNYIWKLIFVNRNNSNLIDRTGNYCLGTTDPMSFVVYIAKGLNLYMLEKVLVHELGHCVMISFGLLDVIHRMVRPEYWIEAEEWLCNYVVDYGNIIFQKVEEIL